MPYDSRVFRVLIASPSDVDEEREIAVRVIQEWNDLHSYSRRLVLLPLRWETHTSPEFGTRPQEVINRAIVDECDVLVGVFWTRIGTPTGESESGTLEEIDRVGRARKPIMLYFSKVGIDPDKLDLEQVKRLKTFKEETYPNALTESYKSVIDFRDKFARQLELKVRDLLKADSSGPPPLSLSFVSIDTADLLGTTTNTLVKLPAVKDLEQVIAAAGREGPRIQDIVQRRIKQSLAIPLVLAIRNESSVSVRDLSTEIQIQSSSPSVDVVNFIPGTSLFSSLILSSAWAFGDTDAPEWAAKLKQTLAHFNEKELQHERDGWRFASELGSLHPQRTHVITPVVYIVPSQSAKITCSAKMYSDSLPQPISLAATLNITVEPNDATVEELVPDLEQHLSKSRPQKGR